MTNEIYDVIIIGSGPAGLTAALYTSRAKLKTLVVGGVSVTSQILMTSDIENYPGISSISGYNIINALKEQVNLFGVQFEAVDIESVEEKDDLWKLNCSKGEFLTCSVVMATGAASKKMNIPGEKEFAGKGVSYCATCDGAFFKDKEIVIVGGGNTAVEEGIFLTRFVKKVTLVQIENELTAERIIQERAFANVKMNFVYNSSVIEIFGENTVKGVKIKNNKTGEVSDFSCEGVFVFIGYLPNTGLVKDFVEIDSYNYIITDSLMNTSKSGIFACGDCRNGEFKQIVTACGDGAVAASSVQKYLNEK